MATRSSQATLTNSDNEARRRKAKRADVTTTVSRAAILLALLATVGCGPRGVTAPKATPTPAPVATGDYPDYGYAPDLSWLSGRFAVAMRGELCPYVVIATHAGVPWGGKFALRGAPGVLDGVREGDMVVVHGAIAKVTSRECGARFYEVSSIERH
jgi:hypothetical protein